MYKVLDKNSISLEIIPHLSVAKRGFKTKSCLTEIVPTWKIYPLSFPIRPAMRVIFVSPAMKSCSLNPLAGYIPSLSIIVVTHFAGDYIYATNKTRKYCSSRQTPIYTSFKPKGRPAKEEAERRLMRSMLSKERSTRLEGSFGTEKEHYNLRKIKTRTKETEILWVFFSVNTANVVRMIPKMERDQKETKQSA